MPPKQEEDKGKAKAGKAKATNSQRMKNVTPTVDPDLSTFPRPTVTFPLPTHTQFPHSTPFTTYPVYPRPTPTVRRCPAPAHILPSYSAPFNTNPPYPRPTATFPLPTRAQSPYSTPFTTYPADPCPTMTAPLPEHTPPSYSAPVTTYRPYPRPTATFPLPTRAQSPYSTPFTTSPATVTFPLPKNTPSKDTAPPPPIYRHSTVPGYRPFLPGPRPHPSGSFQDVPSPSGPVPYVNVHQYTAQQQQQQQDQQEESKEPAVERLPCGRFVIYPSGNSFVSSAVAKKYIKLTIKNNYKKFWPTYDTISKDDKEELFEWFSTKCVWELCHDAQIERNFHHKAATYLADLLKEARIKFAKSKGWYRPRWIGEEIWRQLTYNLYKKKRASQKGGSGNVATHSRCLKNQVDKNPHDNEPHKIRRETNAYVSDTSSSSASVDSTSVIDRARSPKILLSVDGYEILNKCKGLRNSAADKTEGRSLYQQIVEGEGSSSLPKLTPEIVELIQQMSEQIVQGQNQVLQQLKARTQQEQEFREQQQRMMDEIQRQKAVYERLEHILRRFPQFEQHPEFDYDSFSDDDSFSDYDSDLMWRMMEEEEDSEKWLNEEEWLRKINEEGDSDA